VEKHDDKFPENFDEVLALPGIGRYTAGAICSIAFNQPMPVLDGNVIRVLTRVLGIAENPKEKQTNARLWQLAAKLVSRAKAQTSHKNSCSHLNQSLMELGALVCTPRNPQCQICPVKKLCVAFRENRVEKLPNPGKRAAATTRHFVAFLVGRDGKFLVRQRPAGVVNAHLWEFPNVEKTGEGFGTKEIFKSVFGFMPPEFQLLCTLKHSITRYRITLETFAVPLGKSSRKIDGIWKTPAQMQQFAFAAAHKKLASFAANCILSER
jgi:A/G-specific adenine glycosylase